MARLDNSPFDLTGRRILISGAAGGIGSATARLCAQHGARLVLIDIVAAEQIRERVGARVADVAEVPLAVEGRGVTGPDQTSSHLPNRKPLCACEKRSFAALSFNPIARPSFRRERFPKNV